MKAQRKQELALSDVGNTQRAVYNLHVWIVDIHKHSLKRRVYGLSASIAYYPVEVLGRNNSNVWSIVGDKYILYWSIPIQGFLA